jgi:hypothetical protein
LLQDNGVIYLTSSVTELDEVVISPNRATYLLDKAIKNLYANFQKEKTKTYYLTHTERSTTTGGKKEVYALIECILAGKNKKKTKETFNWSIRLAKLDRHNLNASDFTVNGKLFAISFFPHDIEFLNRSSNAKYEIYDDNDSQLTIKMSPKSFDSKYDFSYFYCLWTIDKADTVLTEFIGQTYPNSDELTQAEYKEISYSTSNYFEKMRFMKDDSSGVYYFSEFQQLVSIKVLVDNPYGVVLKALTHSVKNVSPDDIKKKEKIDLPYEGVLFRSRFPDSPGFWKKYVTP